MQAQIEQYCRELDALADFNRQHKEFTRTIAERREEAEEREIISGRAHELALTILSLGSEVDVREFAMLLTEEKYRTHAAIQLADERQKKNLRIPDGVRARSKEIVLEVMAEEARKGNLFFDQDESSTKP